MLKCKQLFYNCKLYKKIMYI